MFFFDIQITTFHVVPLPHDLERSRKCVQPKRNFGQHQKRGHGLQLIGYDLHYSHFANYILCHSGATKQLLLQSDQVRPEYVSNFMFSRACLCMLHQRAEIIPQNKVALAIATQQRLALRPLPFSQAHWIPFRWLWLLPWLFYAMIPIFLVIKQCTIKANT